MSLSGPKYLGVLMDKPILRCPNHAKAAGTSRAMNTRDSKQPGTATMSGRTQADVVEKIADVDVDQVDQADRAYWEKKSEPASLAVMDKKALGEKLPTEKQPAKKRLAHKSSGKRGR